ncbi:unnamed protein product, partial [Ectocarpus sp. 8 AP-2014]
MDGGMLTLHLHPLTPPWDPDSVCVVFFLFFSWPSCMVEILQYLCRFGSVFSCCYYCCCVDIRGAAAACLRLVLESARARPIANLKRAVWFLMVSVVLRGDGGWDVKDG